MILNIVYGYTIKAETDPLVKLANEALGQFVYVSRPGSYTVDFIPWLRFLPSWFPGTGFLKEAKIFKKTTEAMASVPFDLVKSQMVR